MPLDTAGHVVPPPGSPDDPAIPRVRPGLEQAPPTQGPALVTFADLARRETIVPLTHPVLIAGEAETRHEIRVRRLTGQELYDLILQGSPEALGRRVRARMTNTPVGAIEQLDADDTQAVSEAIGPFLPAAIRSLETEGGDGESRPAERA